MGNIRIATGLAFVSGSSVIISSASIQSHYIQASVIDYNILTGFMSFTVRAYSGSSTLIPDDDKIPPPHPSRLPSERVEMTVANIRRREQIFQKYAEDIQGKN